MSDEYKPEPIILSGTPTLSPNPQPVLTGAPTVLSGGGMSTQGPMDGGNVKFVTGPDGQMIAVQKEPFVWKKFFIGLGIPMFLMVLPILMAIILEINDSGYEEEYYVDLKRTDGTAYEADFSLDSELVVIDCYIDENWAHWDHYDDGSYEGWVCDNPENQPEFFHFFDDELTLSRQNGTLYEIEYPLSENHHIHWCSAEIAESSPRLERYYECNIFESNLTFTQYNSSSMNLTRQNGTEYQANFSFDATTSNLYLCDFPSPDGWYYWHECETEYQEESDDFVISISRRINGEFQSVGHWNSTAQILHYDVGYDFGSEITMEYNTESVVGGIQQGESTIQFDSGFWHEEVRIELEVRELVSWWNGSGSAIYFDDGLDHGDEIRINIVAIDPYEMEMAEENYDQMEPFINLSGILCCISPLLSIGLIIYGFAATGSKAVGIGATTALILYPFIGFFAFVTMLSAGY